MPSYYQCDGTVTNIAGGLRCSTTWQTYTPPPPSSSTTMTVSGELLTPQDTLQVFGVVIFLMAFVWLIKIILNTMGIKI